MVCRSFVCGHTYGATEVKKVRLSCFYNFLIWFSRSIINYLKGTLGGFPKFLSKLPVKESTCYFLILLVCVDAFASHTSAHYTPYSASGVQWKGITRCLNTTCWVVLVTCSSPVPPPSSEPHRSFQSGRDERFWLTSFNNDWLLLTTHLLHSSTYTRTDTTTTLAITIYHIHAPPIPHSCFTVRTPTVLLREESYCCILILILILYSQRGTSIYCSSACSIHSNFWFFFYYY